MGLSDSNLQIAQHDVRDNSLSMNEASLIRRIQAGEKEEFRELVLVYKNLVFSMIMRQTANHSVSEELTQEVFVKAFTNIRKFQFRSSFSTWLVRIALNHLNNYFGSKAYKQQNLSVEFNLDKHEQATEDSTSEQGDHDLKLSLFRNALASLKPIYRDVLTLCALEKKSYEEAAEVLEIPVGTIRSRLNKARLLLKDAITNSN